VTERCIAGAIRVICKMPSEWGTRIQFTGCRLFVWSDGRRNRVEAGPGVSDAAPSKEERGVE
jgi:hypothetical protein